MAVPLPDGKHGYVLRDAPYQAEVEILRAKLKVAREGLRHIAEFGTKRDRNLASDVLITVDNMG